MRLALGDPDVCEERLESQPGGMCRPLQLDHQKWSRLRSGRTDATVPGSIGHETTVLRDGIVRERLDTRLTRSVFQSYGYRKYESVITERSIDVTEHDAGDVRSLTMADDEFLSTFERGDFSGSEFPHRAHLRMAWLYVTRLGTEAAIGSASSGIRNLAVRNGLTTLYHDTITRAWVYVVAAATAQSASGSFTGFIEEHPRLLDQHLLLEHYTRETLTSSQARATWVAPDVSPIPGAPADSL